MRGKSPSVGEELAWALDVAHDRVTLAQQLFKRMRTLRIGRLSVSWTAAPARLDPVRLRATHLSAYDLVQVFHEATVLEAGLRVDQVLRIQDSIRIVVDSRFYSNEFYQRAIAKFEEAEAVHF